jgi:hypothetical protein
MNTADGKTSANNIGKPRSMLRDPDILVNWDIGPVLGKHDSNRGRSRRGGGAHSGSFEAKAKPSYAWWVSTLMVSAREMAFQRLEVTVIVASGAVDWSAPPIGTSRSSTSRTGAAALAVLGLPQPIPLHDSLAWWAEMPRAQQCRPG